MINSHLLYQLSYRGSVFASVSRRQGAYSNLLCALQEVKFKKNKQICHATSKKEKAQAFDKPELFLIGSASRARTCDPMINSHLLYQLSYRGSVCFQAVNLKWRPEPESNRRTRICNPLHHHSAIGPPGRKAILIIKHCNACFKANSLVVEQDIKGEESSVKHDLSTNHLFFKTSILSNFERACLPLVSLFCDIWISG